MAAGAARRVSHPTFRRTTKGADPLAGAPRRGRRRSSGRVGRGRRSRSPGARGPVVLPVRWLADEHALYAALPAESLALAGAGPDAAVALTVDQASEWRARDMVGAMVQGTGACYVLGRARVGREDARGRSRRRSHPGGRRARADHARRGWSGGRAGPAGAPRVG